MPDTMNTHVTPPTVALADQSFADQARLQWRNILGEIDNDPRKKRQFDLEIGMVEAGARRFWQAVNKARPHTDAATGHQTHGQESMTPAGKKLLKGAVPNLSKAVQEWCLKAKTGKPGRTRSAVKFIAVLEPEAVAHISFKIALDCAGSGMPTATTATKIGNAIDEELRVREAEKLAPDLIKGIRARFKTANTIHHRRVFQACIHRAGLEDQMQPRKTKEQCLHIGLACLDLVISATGIVESKTELDQTSRIQTKGRASRKTVAMLRFTPDAQRWIGDHDTRAQYLQPVLMPCVIPPRKWKSFRSGGYHYSLARKLPLIKDYDRKQPADRITPETSPAVFTALNAIQRTAWRINKPVLAVMLEAFDMGSTLGGLPVSTQEEIVPLPAGMPEKPEHRSEEQQETLRRWKYLARTIHEDNAARTQKSGVLARTLSIAEEFVEDEAIYFPHFLDFRGRMYPAPMFLNPQGTDWQKSLLTFADCVPLGEQGAAWLALHGANCMAECPSTGVKLDKSQFQTRIDWVQANEEDIIKSAEDPFGHQWWTKADDGKAAWAFLAFCFEWRDYVASGRSTNFTSSLPVSFDGSCNGLQHFSAMLRDEVGGAAVNLTNEPLPRDIYGIVKDAVTARIHTAAQKGHPLAIDWLQSGQLDRKLCKRPVMTMPYGSKSYGMTNQIIEELMKRHHSFGPDGVFKHAQYAATHVWNEITNTVIKAREMMVWLQKLAGLHAKEQKAMTWRTPSGFVVVQDVRENASMRIETIFGAVVFRPRLEVETTILSRHGMENSVAPNFVHSFDAAAQALCVSAMHAEGYRAFASVHDSFGTHAGNAWPLFDTIRCSFVEMYQAWDVVEELEHDCLILDAPKSYWPEPPMPGNLDIMEVLESDFFFA